MTGCCICGAQQHLALLHANLPVLIGDGDSQAAAHVQGAASGCGQCIPGSVLLNTFCRRILPRLADCAAEILMATLGPIAFSCSMCKVVACAGCDELSCLKACFSAAGSSFMHKADNTHDLGKCLYRFL